MQLVHESHKTAVVIPSQLLIVVVAVVVAQTSPKQPTEIAGYCRSLQVHDTGELRKEAERVGLD